jgi:hypothetical protein
MTAQQLRALCALLVAADPWPLAGARGARDRLALVNLANAEAKRHGFDDWITAYHELTEEP